LLLKKNELVNEILDEKKNNGAHLRTNEYAYYKSEQELLQLLGRRKLLSPVHLHILSLIVRLESGWNRE